MGFPYLHRFIFSDSVLYPITNHNRDNNQVCNRIYIDCTGLLYQISFAIPTSIIQLKTDNILLKSLVDSIKDLVNIINGITTVSNDAVLYLFFDGKSPNQKKILQQKRDDEIFHRANNSKERKLFGLSSIIDREERCAIVSNISKSILQEYKNIPITVSSTDEPGEADVKLVKTVLEQPISGIEVIVSTDTDIFISLNSLRKRNVIVLILLPRVGLKCLTSHSLNSWLENNSICYKKLLFYVAFFCGNDYECPIISGTKSQMRVIFEFGKRCAFKVTIKNILTLWSLLQIRPTKSVLITGLSLKVLCELVSYKITSVKSSLKYYSFGEDFPKNHITLLPVFYQWKLLLKNIKPQEIKKLL